MTPDSAANARLCAWLGIAPKRYWTVVSQKVWKDPPQYSSPEHAQQTLQHYKDRYGHSQPWWNDAKVSDENIVYPALDTREGFLILWDALKQAGKVDRMGLIWNPWGATSARLAGKHLGPETIYAEHESPEAALFAAACALMEQEES